MTIKHVFKQEGEFKAMDDKVFEILQKIKAYKEEIKGMWEQMNEGYGLERIRQAEEQIKDAVVILEE